MSTLWAPRNVSGRRMWVDPEIQEFTEHLAALDPELALVQVEGGGWEIWQVTPDGDEYIVAKSRPGAALGPGLIERLAQGRNAKKATEAIIKHNEKVARDAEAAAEESFLVAFDRMLSRSWRGRVPSNVEDLEL